MKQQLSQLIWVPFYSLQSRELEDNEYQLSFFVDRKYLAKFTRMPYVRVTYRNDAIGDTCNKIWIKLNVILTNEFFSVVAQPISNRTDRWKKITYR